MTIRINMNSVQKQGLFRELQGQRSALETPGFIHGLALAEDTWKCYTEE